MFKHHEESIQKLKEYYIDNASVLAVILGGSVAKGLERPDSDLDALVVVTDRYYSDLAKENRLSECIFGHCTYEGGYFDIKYFTMDFLKTAAVHGSEPTRNQFVRARCIFCRDDEIERLVSLIGVFQVSEKKEKMDSFYSAFALNFGYFWKVSRNNSYLRVRSATDIVLFGYRLLLQENEELFPSHKALVQTVSKLKKKPDDIISKGERVLSELSDEAVKDFVDSIRSFIEYQPPKDWSVVLTRFIDDNELWWYKERPLIAEW